MLKLNTFQQDGCVIQRGVRYPVRGMADPHARIMVTYGSIGAGTQAGEDGRWTAWLDPQEAGGPRDLRVEAGADCRVVSNVCVGDVWVCSGQSNMEMVLKDADTGPADALRATDSLLRLATVPTTVTLDPLDGVRLAGWKPCDPESAAAFSAIGYYFGAHLRERLKVPIGLIKAAVGGTPGESWVPMRVLRADPDYGPIFDRWNRSLAVYPDSEKTYDKAFAQWDHDADLAEREGRPIPGAYPKLIGPGHPWTPSGLYQGMIQPLTRFPIRGVIWYQGASVPERAYQYRLLFRRLIRAWREDWGQGDFPFLYLQEANFGPRRDEPGEHSWAELREAQTMALAEPNTAMGVAMDVGEERNIHPVRKKPLGDRLALAARHIVYGEQDLADSSPFYRRMAIEGSRIRIWFEPTYGGLKTLDGGPVKGFAVSAGSTEFTKGTRGFVWAEAEIQGDTVLVGSSRVTHPVAVRYGWAQNPSVNLVNAVGLPACPFRTDDYPGITVGNQ